MSTTGTDPDLHDPEALDAEPPPNWLLAAAALLVALAVIAWFASWWTRGEPSHDPNGDAAAGSPEAPDAQGDEADEGDPPINIPMPSPTLAVTVPVFESAVRDGADWTLLGVGDSWMAGAEAPTGTSFLSVIGRLGHEASGKAVHVANRGQSGTNSAQAWLAAAEAIPEVKPDLVVVTTGIDDAQNHARQLEVDAAIGLSLAPKSASAPAASYTDPLSTSELFGLWEKGAHAQGLARIKDAAPNTFADPGDWEALFTYGLGELDDAAAMGRAQIEGGATGTHPLALLTIGLVEYRYGRTNMGSLYLSQLAAAEPSWFRDLGLGLWSMDRGHHEVAQSALRRALTATPDSPEAQWAARQLPEEAQDASFTSFLAKLPAARPEPWFLLLEAERTSAAPSGLTALAADAPARLLIEAIVAQRAGGAGAAAVDVANDAALPLWLRGHAIAQLVRADTGADPVERASLRKRLHAEFFTVPTALMAQVEVDFEHVDRCVERLEDARLMLRAGGHIQETLVRLSDCAAADALDAMEDASLVERADERERIWAEAVRKATLDQADFEVDAATLTARLHSRLDRIHGATAKAGARMVLVNYAYPDARAQEVNARIAAWAKGKKDVVLVDAWAALRAELDDAAWQALAASPVHLGPEGYRRMGVAAYAQIDAAGLAPR